MKKSLFLCALLSAVLLTGCTLTNSNRCPEGSEYWENVNEDGELTQGCFRIDSDIMEGHWVYYFANGGKDVEGDMVNDLEQGKWTFYDEGGHNIVVMEGYYKDGLEDGKWTYYYDDGTYLCSETYSEGEVVDEGDCEYDHEYEEEAEEVLDESETPETVEEEIVEEVVEELQE